MFPYIYNISYDRIYVILLKYKLIGTLFCAVFLTLNNVIIMILYDVLSFTRFLYEIRTYWNAFLFVVNWVLPLKSLKLKLIKCLFTLI